MNWSCVFFTNTARQVYNRATETVFNYIDTPSFKKFYTETVKGEVYERTKTTMDRLMSSSVLSRSTVTDRSDQKWSASSDLDLVLFSRTSQFETEREYLFAIMAVCQKGTMPIDCGDRKQNKNTKLQVQKVLPNLVSTVMNTHILSFHNTCSS